MTVSYNAVCDMEVPERSQSSKAPKGDSGFKLNVIKLITEVTMPTKDVNFMKSAASIKRRLLASNKFVDQLMATVKTKRARLHRLREETLASGKKTGTLLWQPWPLPWRRGEKICADKEKQMKEEEAAVEAVRFLIQTIKVIVSLRTSKPCVKVRVIFPRRRTRRSLPIDSRSLVSK